MSPNLFVIAVIVVTAITILYLPRRFLPLLPALLLLWLIYLVTQT